MRTRRDRSPARSPARGTGSTRSRRGGCGRSIRISGRNCPRSLRNSYGCRRCLRGRRRVEEKIPTTGVDMEPDPELTAQLKRVLSSLETLLPRPVSRIDWGKCVAANWRKRSFSGYLEPIGNVENLHLEDLLGIEEQKRVVEENTRQFLAGLPANNILLWGSRGSGRSSLVRALVHAYAPQGLRIIQVDKDDLVHLPSIVDEVKGLPYKFILFSDDLSFEPGESSYKMLKSA